MSDALDDARKNSLFGIPQTAMSISDHFENESFSEEIRIQRSVLHRNLRRVSLQFDVRCAMHAVTIPHLPFDLVDVDKDSCGITLILLGIGLLL